MRSPKRGALSRKGCIQLGEEKREGCSWAQKEERRVMAGHRDGGRRSISGLTWQDNIVQIRIRIIALRLHTHTREEHSLRLGGV